MTWKNPDTDFDRHGSSGDCPPDCPEVVIPADREAVTEESQPAGSHHDPHHQDVDWIGSDNQGGGYVPPDYEWTSNPRHDRLPDHKGN